MTKEEAAVFLKDLIQRMNAQDNRATATPYYFVVRTEKWRVAHDEYNSGETRQVRVDFEGDPTTFHSKEEFAKWAREYYDGDPEKDIDTLWDKLEEFTEEKYYEDENVFFTKEAYDEHVRLNGHNLGKRGRDFYSYVKHAFRNPELVKMFEAIGVLVDEEWRKR